MKARSMGGNSKIIIGYKKLFAPHFEVSNYFGYLKALKMALDLLRVAPVIHSSDSFERPVL